MLRGAVLEATASLNPPYKFQEGIAVVWILIRSPSQVIVYQKILIGNIEYWGCYR